MPDWIIKAGDSEPLFYEHLLYSNEEPVNLEGATATFIMRDLAAAEPRKLTGIVTISAAKEGKLYFSPSVLDTATVGNFAASWRIKFSGGEEQTFPTDGYLWVQVQPSLSVKTEPQLINIDELKEEIQIPSADRKQDAKLDRWLLAARNLIEAETGPIIPQTFDEWHGGGHPTISLRHKPSTGYGTSPILQLMAVSEYRGPIEYNLSLIPTPTAGSVYSTMANMELGTIVRRTSGGGTYSFWPQDTQVSQNIHVVYYAGQEEVPANVKMAAVETLKWWWESTQPIGKGFQSGSDFQEAGRPMVGLPYHVREMLGPTQRAPAIA